MVSVIIPVYNAEKTIVKCVETVINQTYKDIEIILINDGSDDKSWDNLQTLCNTDSRIKIFAQKNHGVSYTRNQGINYSSGDYILFVDSDDYLETNYIEELVTPLINKTAELTICCYNEIADNKKKKAYQLSEDDLNHLNNNLYNDFYYIRRFINSPCLKAYQAKIIKDNNICFPENMSTGEDQMFNFRYYRFVQSYYFINKPLYYYVRQQDSLSRKRSKMYMNDDLKVLHMKKDFFQQNPINNYQKILIESICYTIQKYFFLDEDNQNSYNACMKRIDHFFLIKTSSSPDEIKHRILYFMFKNKIVFPYWLLLHIKKKLRLTCCAR